MKTLCFEVSEKHGRQRVATIGTYLGFCFCFSVERRQWSEVCLDEDFVSPFDRDRHPSLRGICGHFLCSLVGCPYHT